MCFTGIPRPLNSQMTFYGKSTHFDYHIVTLTSTSSETLARYEKQANEVGKLGRLKWEYICRGTDTRVRFQKIRIPFT